MILTCTPEQPLASFVELFWHCEGDANGAARERVLPTGAAQLIISLRDETLRTCGARGGERWEHFRGPLVCGPHSRCSIIDTSPLSASIGVQFKAAGAHPFFHIPAGELHNLNVPLDALWGPAADELCNRLREARTPNARFLVLEQSLRRRLDPEHEGHHAVAFALKAFQAGPHHRTIREVAEQAGLSQKWLSQVFRNEVGLAPKVYRRLQRFQGALTLIGGRRQLDWAGLALACGYYDQAHFNREFRAFSGLCPTSYVAGRGEHQNHVRVSD